MGNCSAPLCSHEPESKQRFVNRIFDPSDPEFNAGVELFRQGQYVDALIKSVRMLHKEEKRSYLELYNVCLDMLEGQSFSEKDCSTIFEFYRNHDVVTYKYFDFIWNSKLNFFDNIYSSQFINSIVQREIVRKNMLADFCVAFKNYFEGIGKSTTVITFKYLSEKKFHRAYTFFADMLSDKGDKKESFVWYKHAADLGYQTAQYRVAKMYLEGDIVEKNYCEAVRYYFLSLNGKHKQGCVNVGWDHLIFQTAIMDVFEENMKMKQLLHKLDIEDQVVYDARSMCRTSAKPLTKSVSKEEIGDQHILIESDADAELTDLPSTISLPDQPEKKTEQEEKKEEKHEENKAIIMTLSPRDEKVSDIKCLNEESDTDHDESHNDPHDTSNARLLEDDDSDYDLI